MLPDTSASNQEIIQHVHTMSLNSQDSLQTHLGGLIGTGGDTHDAIPSKLTSPKQEMIHSVKLEHDPHSAFHRVEKAHPDEEV